MTRLFGILLLLISVSAHAEDERTFEEVMNSIKEPLFVRVSEGVIRSLDLTTRTGIIGGHKYWFGPAFSESPLQVTMYGSEGGALELLQPGMKVEVTYGDTGDARIAVRIRQLADDADIEN